MDYSKVSYENLIQIYREGNDKERRDILESGIDVLDFMKNMNSPEIAEALRLTKDRDKILTELIESPEKNSEFLRGIDSKDIQNEINDLSKNKLVLLLTGKYNIETRETINFLEKVNDLVEEEKDKSQITHVDEQRHGENNLANQEINPNTSKENYMRSDMENNYNTFVHGEPQSIAETYAELEANSQENKDKATNKTPDDKFRESLRVEGKKRYLHPRDLNRNGNGDEKRRGIDQLRTQLKEEGFGGRGR